jgi:hypothetical protein
LICTTPQENRRDLLRRFMTGFAAAAVATIDTEIGSAQAVNPRRPLAEKLYVSKYLPEAYTQAVAALLNFDNLTAAGKSAAARDALTKAATITCDALARLANDSQLWATLGEQREPIGKNAAEIKRLLSNLEEFLPEEEKVLQLYMPAGPRMRLVSDLSRSLSRFRDEPTSWTLEDLRRRVNDSHDAVCAAAKPPANEPRSDFFSDYNIIGDGLGVLGGAATIVLNLITGMEPLHAWVSAVCGIGSMINSSNGVIQEIRSRKR